MLRAAMNTTQVFSLTLTASGLLLLVPCSESRTVTRPRAYDQESRPLCYGLVVVGVPQLSVDEGPCSYAYVLKITSVNCGGGGRP